jgi:hypothetical protein
VDAIGQKFECADGPKYDRAMSRMPQDGRRDAGVAGSREQRLGERIIIEEPAVLEVCHRIIHGTIHDVGARGVYFSAAEQPLPGARGVLRAPGGEVDVRVVWAKTRGNAGVGLVFGA